MSTYEIKYRLGDETEEKVVVTASDKTSAGTAFAKKFPHIPADDVVSIVPIGNDPLSLLENGIVNLWKGNLGLAITYWVYGVLGGVVWAVAILALDLKKDSSTANLVIVFMAIYYFYVYVGIWRAASKYRGNRLWEILAKFVVVITVLPIIIRFLK